MSLTEALVFLIRVVMGLYVTIVLLRFLFQLARADFYNPFSQAIVKLTSPVVVPMRRVLPSIGRIDTATVVLALLVEAAMIFIIMQVRGFEISIPRLAIISVFGLVREILDIYMIALFIVVILSWVAPFSRSPGAVLVHQLTEPLLQPVRRILPPLGGFDFSVMVVLLVVYMCGRLLQYYVLPF